MKKIRLIDLKTKGNTKYDFKKRTGWREPYRTDKQLGCYIEMLKLNCDIEPDIAVVLTMKGQGWFHLNYCHIAQDIAVVPTMKS